ncbi:hypothetical protein ABZT49_31410 [Methylobacterium sp. EM32]|uniref:hypothetical protein n=1 Tax=Methylobacterium sp. EM32 TaxID=3163481 RepID=UPI0033B05442
MRARFFSSVIVPVALIFVVLSSYQGTRAQELPRALRDEIDRDVRDCTPGKDAPRRRFISRQDVNRDGVPDFILDYGGFQCGSLASHYCGPAGCATVVYASKKRNGYVKVFSETVRDRHATTVNGRPALVAGLPGSACGLAPFEPCRKTLTWDGARFVPGREAPQARAR